MSSRVTVINSDARRHIIRVSPTTHISDILQEACSKFGFDPDKYGLKYRNNTLDISNPFRLSGLPPGATLNLTLQSRSPSVVSVALQLPQSEAKRAPNARLVDRFPSTTTLWLILRKFEAGVAGGAGARNFTARGVPKVGGGTASSGGGRLYYETPALQIMGREYSSFTDLQKTLASIGYNSGSILIRLSFSVTETPLEEAMEQIGGYFKQEDTEEAENTDLTPHDASATVVTQSDELKTADKLPEALAEKGPSLDPPVPEPQLSAATEETSSSQTPQAQHTNDTKEASAAAIPANFVPSLASSTPGSSSRPIAVFAPPSDETIRAAQTTARDSDFVPTIEHAKQYQAQLQASLLNRRLPSDAEIAAQQAKKAEKLASISEIDIKVRFPDLSSVVIKFSREDNGTALYTQVNSLLAREGEPFDLIHRGPKGQRTLPRGQERLIGDLGMNRRDMVNFLWGQEASAGARNGPCLKAEVAQNAKQMEIAAPQAEPAKDSEAAQEKPQQKGKGKGKVPLPKWFKMAGMK